MERLIQAIRAAVPGAATCVLRGERLPRGGEGLDMVRIADPASDGRTWVAKRLDPRLRRERAAYEGPLAGSGVAPAMVAVVEEGDACWIILEDAGLILRAGEIEDYIEEAGRLAGRIHAVAWRPARHLRWPRPTHVVHDRRHLRGEWRIALRRMRAAADAGVLDAGVLPQPRLSSALFERALEALGDREFTVVHGDLGPGNVARDPSGSLLALDWSNWGWGSPVLDLIALAAEVDEGGRERLLRGYLGSAGSAPDLARWEERVDRALGYRLAVGLGVLAEYARRGEHAADVRERLPRRLAQWTALLGEVASWS